MQPLSNFIADMIIVEKTLVECQFTFLSAGDKAN